MYVFQYVKYFLFIPIEDWLKPCQNKVDSTFLANLQSSCKIDLCALSNFQTQTEILEVYVAECRKKVDLDLLCHWGINSILWKKCGKNEIFTGCMSNSDLKTCENFNSTNNFDGFLTSGCLCKPGFRIINGRCRPESECKLSSWAKWSEWTECSDPCLIGSFGKRSRLRFLGNKSGVEN